LVVDDDPALLRMIRLTLISDGLEVTEATDGLAGLEALEAGEFDLVILDLQMPKMDGREMYRQMRARGYDLPVLILSAYRAEAARIELGADAALSKPFDIDVLLAQIEALLTANLPGQG
jgi:DNA-binding response OmpR family regulator